MKVKKRSQEPVKSPGGRKLIITRKEKRDLSKLTTEEFLEQDFENDIDSDIYDSDEKDKNTYDEDSEQPDSDNDSDTDSDFYEYLKENDKNLLDFEVSNDEDNDNSSINDSNDEDNDNSSINNSNDEDNDNSSINDSNDEDNDNSSINDSNDEDNDNSSINDSNDEDNDNSSINDSNDEDNDNSSINDSNDEDNDNSSINDSNDEDNDNSSINDSNDEDNDNSSINDSNDKNISNENLEVTSNDNDFQPEEAESDCKKITMQLLKAWQQEIQTDKSTVTIKHAVEAFHAALNSIAVSPDITMRYKVEGSATFNGVVQLCITHLPDAFRRFLNLDLESQEAHKSKRFEKIQEILKLYLSDLVKLLQSVASSNNILVVLLKHLHQMLPYTESFSSLTKPLLKILLELWSTAEETVRVIAFLNILHIAISKEFVLEELLETMYEKYVQNTKFVSLSTLPGINFMRHSLVEIYLLDHNISYRHAFLHIRQLALNLRNAVTLKNKENFQVVYNWQYINSLRFWTELINKSQDKSMLRSLLYPLVQIITGIIKVIPTVQYYPLRFHCLEMLITISKETGTFIPILPFLLEILNSYDFNKRHKAVTMKPISLVCILRVSKSQLIENGFKDSIIETIYQLILEHAANESHRIYFPDLYVPCIIQLKEFLEKCHVATYCKKMKQLLTIIEENKKYIETERAKVTIDLKNMSEITNWENRMKTDGTVIAKFYASGIKLRESQKRKLLTKNKEEFNVSIERKSTKHKLDRQNAEDSEEESEFKLRVEGIETKAERRSNKKKANKIKRKNSQ